MTDEERESWNAFYTKAHEAQGAGKITFQQGCILDCISSITVASKVLERFLIENEKDKAKRYQLQLESAIKQNQAAKPLYRKILDFLFN